MRTILVFALSMFINESAAQNLILNGSFEDTLPKNLNPNFGGPETCPPWFTPICGGSADYISANYYYPIIAKPANIFGYQNSHTGIAYCGFMSIDVLNPNAREMISVNLVQQLIFNHKYMLSYYISCANNADVAVDSLGVYFSIDTPDFCLGLIYQPQIVSGNGTYLNDTANWIELTGSFIAQGDEQIMTIGNFDTDVNTGIYNFPNGTIGSGYYYIDDFSLIDCTAVGLAEIAALGFQLLNNPVYDALHFTSYQKITNAYITDMLGKIILQNEFNDAYFNYQINVATLPRGIYLLAVEDKNKRRVVKKFIKM